MDKVLFSHKSCEWETPKDLFEGLNKQYDFNLDVCATKENAKCACFFDKKDDGLIQEWKRKRIWCNPPYGNEIAKWVKKAYDSRFDNEIIVMLLPARTDTRWFHEYIYNKAEVVFLKGRLKFGNSKNSAPFPSMIVVFRNDR